MVVHLLGSGNFGSCPASREGTKRDKHVGFQVSRMTKIVSSDEKSEEILTALQTSFASDLIRSLAYKGLSAPDSLEPEEISQLCMAVLAHINNRGALEL